MRDGPTEDNGHRLGGPQVAGSLFEQGRVDAAGRAGRSDINAVEIGEQLLLVADVLAEPAAVGLSLGDDQLRQGTGQLGLAAGAVLQKDLRLAGQLDAAHVGDHQLGVTLAVGQLHLPVDGGGLGARVATEDQNGLGAADSWPADCWPRSGRAGCAAS